jgi:hypothetical protein
MNKIVSHPGARMPRKKTQPPHDPPQPIDPFMHFRETLFPGGFTLRDEANAIVAWAFRNGPLENLHAGKHSALLEDRSLSRITDEEMKELMLNACAMVEKLLRLKETDRDKYYLEIVQYNLQYCRKWQR